MKILAVSDLHRDQSVARSIVEQSIIADLVVCAGDLATKGLGLADTIGILRAITVPTLLVSGNHESVALLEAACADWPASTVLHGNGLSLGGVEFFGLGYEIPAGSDAPWNSGLTEDAAMNMLAACPQGAVLITHAPAFGVADIQRTGAHEGSRAIRACIERTKPRLHLCGHIHNAWGMSGEIAGCMSHNLGPVVNWFEI